MELKKQITVNAPFETVWKILFEDFDKVGDWTTAVDNSVPNPHAKPVNGEDLGGRICDSPFGRTVENFIDFDERHNRFTYEVESGLPFFVKHGQNTWQVTPKGKQTLVDMHMVMDLNLFPGKLMQSVMRRQMNNLVDDLLEELKFYAETGEVHARVERRNAA